MWRGKPGGKGELSGGEQGVVEISRGTRNLDLSEHMMPGNLTADRNLASIGTLAGGHPFTWSDRVSDAQEVGLACEDGSR